MRLSVNEGDPGYQPYRTLAGNGCVLDITMDGEKLTNVITADSKQGYADVMKRGDDGYLYIDQSTGEVATERRYGKVEFTIKPAA